MNLSKKLAMALIFLTPFFSHATNEVQFFLSWHEKQPIHATIISKDLKDNTYRLVLMTGDSSQECRITKAEAAAVGHTLASLQSLLATSKNVLVKCIKLLNGSNQLYITDNSYRGAHIGEDSRDKTVYLSFFNEGGDQTKTCNIRKEEAAAAGHTLGSLQLLMAMSEKVRIKCEKSTNGSTQLTISEGM